MMNGFDSYTSYQMFVILVQFQPSLYLLNILGKFPNIRVYENSFVFEFFMLRVRRTEEQTERHTEFNGRWIGEGH
jgi:hypothetical protein